MNNLKKCIWMEIIIHTHTPDTTKTKQKKLMKNVDDDDNGSILLDVVCGDGDG